jgi:hypothetical protein
MKKLSIVQLLSLSSVVLLTLLLIWIHRPCLQSTVSLINNDCEQSLIESDGFICESKSVWNERKQIFQSQNKENMIRHPDTFFFLTNWEPTFHCSHTRRIGASGDGGKWVCDPYRLKSQHNCLIYSVGSSGDFSFEIEMKKLLPHCDIHSFDKNLYSCPKNICTFHQVTFGNGIYPNRSKIWQSIVEELNHKNRLIDILKIDIEGGEYTFFPVLLNSEKSALPRQILVEVHPVNVSIIHDFFDRFRDNHYVISIKENNLLAGPYFFEYAFLKLNPRFFVQSHDNNIHR